MASTTPTVTRVDDDKETMTDFEKKLKEMIDNAFDKFDKAFDKTLEKWRLSWTEGSMEHQTTTTKKWGAEVEDRKVHSDSTRHSEFSKEEVHDVDIVCQKASAVKVFDGSPERDLEENAYDSVNSVETRKGDMIGERGNRPGLAPFQLHTPTGTHPEFSSYITPHFNCYDEFGKGTDVRGYGEVGTDFWGSYKDGGSGGGPGQGRVRTLDIPRFDGNDSDGWIRRVEQLLYVYRVSESELLKVIEMAFVGDVLRWYQWENNRRPFRCWSDLKGVILRQYRSSTCQIFRSSNDGYGESFRRSEFPLPALGLPEGEKQRIRDWSSIMDQHFFADKNEDFVNAQVNALLSSLDIDSDVQARAGPPGRSQEMENVCNDFQNMQNGPDGAVGWIAEYDQHRVQRGDPNVWAQSFEQLHGANGWASEFENVQSQIATSDQAKGASIPGLATMEQTRVLAHTLAQNQDPKFQNSKLLQFVSKTSCGEITFEGNQVKSSGLPAPGDWATEYQQKFSGGQSWVNQFEREEFYRGPAGWVNEFTTASEQQGPVDDQWVNEFSKLQVQDWVDEFGRQVGEGILGDDSGAYTYDDQAIVQQQSATSNGQELFHKGLLQTCSDVDVTEEEVELTEMFDKVLLCEPCCDKEESIEFSPASHHKSWLAQGSNGSKSRSKRTDSNSEAVDLRTLLISCAQSVASEDRRSAYEQLKLIRQYSSASGDASQRLAHVFTNGLEARMAGTGTQLYATLSSRRISTTEKLKAYQAYLLACPFKKTSVFFANKMILEKSSHATTLHIIDFGIQDGFQWPGLIQCLSRRPGGPPKLRITGLELPQPGFKPAEYMEATERRLRGYCERFNVPFEYNPIATQKWEAITVEDLKIRSNEVVAVNCLLRFENLLDETVAVNNPRDAVLKLIRKVNPAICVQAVVNGSYSAFFFVTRFREALFHYSVSFDILDTTMPCDDPQRLNLEREFCGREVMNVIACEGAERVQTKQKKKSFKSWKTADRMVDARVGKYMVWVFDPGDGKDETTKAQQFYHSHLEDKVVLGGRGNVMH